MVSVWVSTKGCVYAVRMETVYVLLGTRVSGAGAFLFKDENPRRRRDQSEDGTTDWEASVVRRASADMLEPTASFYVIISSPSPEYFPLKMEISELILADAPRGQW